MSIYDFDTDIVIPNLTPKVKRLPKYLAWVKSLGKAVQWAWNNLFSDWQLGSLYARYNGATSYVFGNQVIFTDNKVYLCISNAPITGVDCLSAASWLLVNDNFIGSKNRIKYTSQIITFEAHLNKWFNNVSATAQIYIGTNQISTRVFVMGLTGPTSSAMANNSAYSNTFMYSAPTFTAQYNLSIYIPIALFNSLGSNPANRENAIRKYADKYVLGGIYYNVLTF